MTCLRLLLPLLFSFAFASLSAQVSENFSDGDFTNNPTWVGDATEWEVLNGELHLNNAAPASSNDSYLSTPSTVLDNATWEFYVRMDFNPSSANFVDVFLASDLVDLEGSVDGYFVRIGGSSDEVSLFESSAGSTSEIIDGLNGMLVGAPVDVRVRVTRDGAGNWELFSDTSGTGTNYFSEGTVNDLTHTSSAHFGIKTRYSTTRNTWCYFDSISVSAVIVPDTTPPTVLGLTVSSATEVVVNFSENVDVATAQTLGNYLRNGATNPATAAVDAVDSTMVRLGFGSPFPVCVLQDLAISNVEDRAGNVMANTTQTFSYAVAAAVPFKGVIINEIFADENPQVGLPTEEFVELYNRSAVPVDLIDWTFSDGGTPQSITTTSYLLCPGEYVILTGDSSVYSSFGPVIEMNLPTLNNGGDPLGLRDSAGTLIDSVEYDQSWYGGSPWDAGGYSLELINPTDTCSMGAANWSHSNDPVGGTPGQGNSILNTTPDVTAPSLLTVVITGASSIELCFDESLDAGSATNPANYMADNGLGVPSTAVISGTNMECVALTFPTAIDTGTLYTITASNIADCKGNALASQNGQFIIPGPTPFRAVIFNEVFPDPDTSLTNMPNGEFFELYNRSGALVDLAGWTFSDASSTVTLGSYLLQPGAYVAVCRQVDSLAYAAFGPVLTLSSLPSLNNSGDELGLRDGMGALIDTLEYDDSMYQDPNKEDGGYSLELINPNDTCSFFGNWIASNDPDGGTPGEQNSVFNNTPDITAPALVGITVLSATSVEVCFDETMDIAQLGVVGNYSIDNGLGTPSLATPQGPEYACVVLDLATSIDTGTIYTITFTNLTDCKGNSVGILTGTFVLGGSAAPFQVLINELMADPTPANGLPEEDFVELYNAGNTVVDLAGWVISDPSSTDAVLPSYNLFPGEYVIVCDDGDVSGFSALGPTVGTPSFPALNTTGDSVNLFDGAGTLIDYVYYEDDWYGDEDKEDGGWTLERVDPSFTCHNSGNWRASNNPLGGTPGIVNSVLGTFSDTEQPGLVRAELLNGSTVRVYFDELMDPASLYDPANYTVDNGVGNPIMVVPVGDVAISADLLLATALDTNIIYCVTVTGVSDCPGNLLGSDNTVCFGIPLPVEPGDIVINEILFNPYTGGSDFVELYNVSDKVLDLSSVYIGEIFEGTDSIFNADQISTSQLLLLPESYICLTADRDVQISTYQPIDPDAIFEMSSFPSYDDSDGECVVYTDTATILDRFMYLDDYQFPNLDDDNGVSLERHDFFRPTQDPDNWHSAASTVLYATPGYKNSQVLEAGEESAEVWLEPETFSPDIDGFQDVLGINYQFNTAGWNARITVFDNKGRLVRELQENTLLGTEGGTFTWDGTTDSGAKAGVGVYVILFEASNPNTGEVKKFKLGCVLAASFN